MFTAGNMFVDKAGVGQFGIAQLTEKLVSWKQVVTEAVKRHV